MEFEVTQFCCVDDVISIPLIFSDKYGTCIIIAWIIDIETAQLDHSAMRKILPQLHPQPHKSFPEFITPLVISAPSPE